MHFELKISDLSLWELAQKQDGQVVLLRDGNVMHDSSSRSGPTTADFLNQLLAQLSILSLLALALNRRFPEHPELAKEQIQVFGQHNHPLLSRG
jgi:hypothetical protein